MGESGSGKSTVVLALLGLLGPQGFTRARVSATRLTLGDADLLTQAAAIRGRRIGTVFQDPSSALNPALTIGTQVAEPLRVHAGLGAAAARTEAAALLAETGLPRPAALLDAYPHHLSGGMKQRVAIAMALAARPELLLLDEPTTALDVTVEAGILDLLEDLRARRGLSLLLVSHNLAVVSRICEDVTVLYAGRVVESGPARTILRTPAHPYPRGLLAAMPQLDGHRRLAPIPGTLPDLRTPDPGCNFRPRCPFAAAGCEQPQTLAPFDHTLVRCHRAAAIQGAPWPAPPPAPPRPTPSGVLLSGENLSRRFGPVRAVSDVSLTIAPGEILGLVGESGCGKSTLGWLLMRLHRADSGTLTLANTPIPDPPGKEFRRRVGIVLQNPDTALNPRHSVDAALRRPLAHFGLARGAAATTEIARLLDLVRLPRAYAARYPHQLSGGEKQRVGLARALAGRPEFLVCDEPVSALDVSVQAATLELLAELRATLGLAMLFISHDLGVIAHLADRVAVMYGGRIMELGPTAAVLRPPFHPYTEALLSAVPSIEGDIETHRTRIRLKGEPGDTPPGPGCRFATRCHRRLGPICDTPSPERPLGPHHWARCHIEPHALIRLEAP